MFGLKINFHKRIRNHIKLKATCQWPKMKQLLIEWLNVQRVKKICISGPLLKASAFFGQEYIDKLQVESVPVFFFVAMVGSVFYVAPQFGTASNNNCRS